MTAQYDPVGKFGKHWSVGTFSVINVNTHSVAAALQLKASNTALSDKSRLKLEDIANRQYGGGLGRVFTSARSVQIARNDLAKLRAAADLRQVIVTQGRKLSSNPAMAGYLTQVLARLPPVQWDARVPARSARPESGHRREVSARLSAPVRMEARILARSARAEPRYFREVSARPSAPAQWDRRILARSVSAESSAMPIPSSHAASLDEHIYDEIDPRAVGQRAVSEVTFEVQGRARPVAAPEGTEQLSPPPEPAADYDSGTSVNGRVLRPALRTTGRAPGEAKKIVRFADELATFQRSVHHRGREVREKGRAWL